MSDRNYMLSQEEIDALLKVTEGEVETTESVSAWSKEERESNNFPASTSREGDEESSAAAVHHYEMELTAEEADALGEVGNISMGSSATTLSELLNQKVTITSPKINTCLQEELFATFKTPHILVQVEFKTGLEGFNVLIIQLQDAIIMADLMMGGDGSTPVEQVSEMELSAASEAMNQMIGTASTSLSTIFDRTISISPPTTAVLKVDKGAIDYRLSGEDPVVVISFNMTIGDLLDTEIMQIVSMRTAKEEANLLLQQLKGTEKTAQPEEQVPEQELLTARENAAAAATVSYPDFFLSHEKDMRKVASGSSFLSEVEQRRLELLLDIPLKASVILGRTKRPIKEVLNLTPGAIVELSSHVDEPVEILVNGILVARGEVVVAGENFGVRITGIISPRERIQKLSV